MKTLRMTLQEPDKTGEYFMARIVLQIPESGNIEAYIQAAYQKLERDLHKMQWDAELSANSISHK